MLKNLTYIVMLLAAGFAVSCSEADDTTDGNGTTTQRGLELWASINGSDVVETRVKEEENTLHQTFEYGDQIGFFSEGGDADNNNGPFSNIHMTCGGIKSDYDGQSDGGTGFYNKEINVDYNSLGRMAGYYPYNAGIESEQGVPIRTLEGDPTSPVQDFLFSFSYQLKKNEEGLTGRFKHGFCMLEIILEDGFYFRESDQTKSGTNFTDQRQLDGTSLIEEYDLDENSYIKDKQVIEIELKRATTNVRVENAVTENYYKSFDFITYEQGEGYDDYSKYYAEQVGTYPTAVNPDEVSSMIDKSLIEEQTVNGENKYYLNYPRFRVILPVAETNLQFSDGKTGSTSQKFKSMRLKDRNGVERTINLANIYSSSITRGNKYRMHIKWEELQPTINNVTISDWTTEQISQKKALGIKDVNDLKNWSSVYKSYKTNQTEANIEKLRQYGNLSDNIWTFFLSDDIVIPTDDYYFSKVSAVIDEFTDVFDGRGFSISGLSLQTSNENGNGFIQTMEANAEIRNLTIESIKIGSSSYPSTKPAGAIAAKMTGGTIENCTVRGIDITTTGIAGAAVGVMQGGEIKNCTFSGTVICGSGSASDKLVGSKDDKCTFTDNDAASLIKKVK